MRRFMRLTPVSGGTTNLKTIQNLRSFFLESFTLWILPMQYRRHLLSSVTSESLVDKGESSFSKFLSAGQSLLLARGTFQIFRVYCIIISFSIFLKRNCCSAYQLWSVAVSSGKQRSL
ncbi:hypothetical protein V8G54_035203 [Vigna mungo]|uniref:Uncharacterized protein n=1 Tax=Vigna mungo TaxID=3915 RepID=A0AAQ3MEV4_VIGMU